MGLKVYTIGSDCDFMTLNWFEADQKARSTASMLIENHFDWCETVLLTHYNEWFYVYDQLGFKAAFGPYPTEEDAMEVAEKYGLRVKLGQGGDYLADFRDSG